MPAQLPPDPGEIQADLFLGIDTGGTYTDGVLLDPQSRHVIQTVKTLTTHADLRQCIGVVLDHLISLAPRPVTLVSLSTTLATNAILEDKRRPVGLLLLGYDRQLVEKFNFQRQFGTSHVRYIAGRHDLAGAEQAPLDRAQVAQAAAELCARVDAFAIASYAGPANASHEITAGEIVAETIAGVAVGGAAGDEATRLPARPVVLAHELSSELNSILRATTASLNASILGEAGEFLQAVLEMMQVRGLSCPVMIMRSDGSLARAGFASRRPAEIIHSGPATSAIGGQFLADVEKAVVVDIGGTSTDIALVENGHIPLDPQPARIGSFRTCVRTVHARTVGLGGDSRISFDHWQHLAVGPERLLPISYLASTDPQVKQDLKRWLAPKSLLYSERAEYWRLRRRPRQPMEDAQERRIVALLEDGPRAYASLMHEVGPISPFTVRALVKQEIVERAGLTPTDLLHLTGEFTPWDGKAAEIFTAAAARHWNESPVAFAQRVRRRMTETITLEILQFISGHTLSASGQHSHGLDRWLFAQSLQPSNDYLGNRIFLKVPLVGIGAPARAFLPAVAEALDTQAIFPEHYAVANAVGTVVSSILVRKQGEIYPNVQGSAVIGYCVRAGNHNTLFDRYAPALAYARQTLLEQASLEARAAGAASLETGCEVEPVWEGMARLTAWAAGRP